MLIHIIAHLSHEELNMAKEFGGKTGEKDLVERMKKYFDLVKKSRGYSIQSILDPRVQITTQILVGNVMSEFRMDEVQVLVVSVVAQCVKGVKFD